MPGNATKKCPKTAGNLVVQVRRQNEKKPQKWNKLSNKCALKLTGTAKIDSPDASIRNKTTFKNLCPGSYQLKLTPQSEEALCDIEETINQGKPLGGAIVGANMTQSVTVNAKATPMHYYWFYPYELRVQVEEEGAGTKLKGVKVIADGDPSPEEEQKTTDDKGLADFGIVKNGSSFTLKVELNEEHKKLYIPEASYGPAPAERLEKQPFIIRLKPKPKIYMQLLYKDPEGKDHSFPKDFPVKVVFDDNKDLKVVLDEKGKFDFEPEPAKKWFTLDFESNKVRYLVHKKGESAGKWVHDDTPILEDPNDDKLRELTLAGKRFFSLPKKWTLANSQWEPEKLTKPLPEKAQIKIKDDYTGSKDTPAKLTLTPKVLHARFEYHDRKYGHSDHSDKRVSIPPIILKGARKADASGAPVDPSGGTHDTISNWMVESTDITKACQGLPWILTKKDDGTELTPFLKKDMLLEFGWENGYVFSEHATDVTKRKIMKIPDGDAKLKPSKDRPKYYDLPKQWKSLNYYTRFTDDSKNKFFDDFTNDDEIKIAYVKTTPMTFSLDDIVLIHKDDTYLEHTKMDKDKTTDKPLSKHSRVALLYLDSTKKYKVKIYKPRAKAAYHSESEFVKDKDNKYRNVIVDYHPDTRSVVFCNGFHDIYNKRTEGTPDFGKKQVLGARAAKLEDSEVSVKKCFDQNADVTAGYVHQKRLYDLHYLHYGAADDNKVYNALVTYWSALVFSKTANEPSTWDTIPGYTDRPLTENVTDTRNYREVGMENAMSRWNDKDYQYENSTNPVKIVIKSFFLFEAKDVEDPLDTFISLGGPAHCNLAVGTGGSWATNTKMYMRIDAYKDEAKPYKSNLADPDDPLNNKDDYDGSKTQRLTLAHELGHSSGLFDDYITSKLKYNGLGYPVWSYNQKFPGMPYSIDNLALMKTNHAIRMRYFWGKAKWLNDSTKTGKDLESLLKDEKFKITFSPTGKTALKFSFEKDEYNNIYKPAYKKENVDFGNDATNDLFLYKLGDGETARAITNGETYDGILVVRTNISIRFINGTDGSWQWGNPDYEPYFWMQALEKDIRKMLNGKDKYQEYGKFKCACDADNDFEHTYLMFAPHWEIKANEGDAASGGTHFKLIVKKDKDALDNSKKSEAFAFANDKITVGYNCNNKKIIRYLYGKNSDTDDLDETDLTKISDWVGHSDRADGSFEIEAL